MKKETFTCQVKEEIVSLDYSKENLFALLSGFIKVNGSLSFRNKNKYLTLKTENSKIAKLIYNSLKFCFDVSPSFSYSRKMKLHKNVVYHIILQEKVDYILEKLELFDGIFSIFPKEIVLEEGLRLFIAGVFLASGSINSPTSDNYHLQMVLQEEDTAKNVLKLLNRFRNEKNMDFKLFIRKNKYIVYLKKADQIATFLAIVGASNNMLEFENSRIEKDFINSENRLTICVTANYQKTLKKALDQLEDIKYIKSKNQFVALTDKEKALCELRENNVEASLLQLSELLMEEYGIKVSKSGVNHLFSSIKDKAELLRKGKFIH